MEITSFLWMVLLSYIFSNASTFLTIKFAHQQQVFEANDYRKIHVEKVAALGGIPIFMTLVVSSFLVIQDYVLVLPIIGAASLLLLVGLWDDLKSIGIKRRLLTQIVVAHIAYFAGFQFNIATNLFPVFINYGLTITFICAMINGTNFIDGINGLAGGLGFLAMVFFAWIFTSCGMEDYTYLCLLYGGGILGFLRYNFGKKATIFMGDNGSTVLGFLLALFTLKIWSVNHLSAISVSTVNICLSLIALPILDLFGVIGVRLFRGCSPFSADRNHLHHLMSDNGKTHPETCSFILGWILSLAFLFYNEIITTMPVALLTIILSYLLLRIWFSSIKFPATFPAKWGKLVPQQS